jgi:hypothetical protein
MDMEIVDSISMMGRLQIWNAPAAIIGNPGVFENGGIKDAALINEAFGVGAAGMNRIDSAEVLADGSGVKDGIEFADPVGE